MASLFFYLKHFLLSLCRSDSHRHIFLCSFSFCWRWCILTNLLYSVWKLCIWILVWRLCSHLFSRYQLADCQTHTVLSPRDTWATLQIVRCNLPTDWPALLSSCFSEVWNKLTFCYRHMIGSLQVANKSKREVFLTNRLYRSRDHPGVIRLWLYSYCNSQFPI